MEFVEIVDTDVHIIGTLQQENATTVVKLVAILEEHMQTMEHAQDVDTNIKHIVRVQQ